MKVLVIGGMHGNEPLGLAVVEMFKNNPQPGVGTIYANSEAIAANSRFVGQDLNRSFPGAMSGSTYEARRAAEILDVARKYDVVLDFHNTHCPGNDCGFVGESADQQMYDSAWELGLRRMIVADYDCINKFAPNCVSVEISLDSDLNDPKLWFDKICMLANSKRLHVKPNFETYRFVYRMTLEDKERLKLPEKNLRAFEPIDKELADKLGVSSPAYPIFIGDSYTPYNYGGVLNKL